MSELSFLHTAVVDLRASLEATLRTVNALDATLARHQTVPDSATLHEIARQLSALRAPQQASEELVSTAASLVHGLLAQQDAGSGVET